MSTSGKEKRGAGGVFKVSIEIKSKLSSFFLPRRDQREVLSDPWSEELQQVPSKDHSRGRFGRQREARGPVGDSRRIHLRIFFFSFFVSASSPHFSDRERGDSVFFSLSLSRAARRGERSRSSNSSSSAFSSSAQRCREPPPLSVTLRAPLKEETRREREAEERKHRRRFSEHSLSPFLFFRPPRPPLSSSPTPIMASSDQEDLPLLTKPASLQTPTKALLPGTLSIARMRGSWLPQDATSAAPLHFAYAALTGALQRAKGKPMLRLPLPTGPRVIVFESVEDTDQVVDLLTPLIAREQQGSGAAGGAAAAAAGAPSSSAAAAAAASRQPAKADAWSQAKRKLLEEDKCVLFFWRQRFKGKTFFSSLDP